MKSCRKPNSGHGTKYPCICMYHMREFNKKHEEKCKTLEIPEPACKTLEFMTGSFYKGGWQKGCGMHGYGVYTFNNGVIYEGEFFDGDFHGKGELQYQTPVGKAVIRGQWNKGVMTKRTVLFDDALEHDAENWQYCKMPDRRFMREYTDGVQPSGKSFMTAKQPYVEVPDGYIDTGEGVLDPINKLIYEHNDHTKVLRGPGIPEQKWILEHCRIGKKDLIVGPRKNLYEKYMEPKALLEQVPTAPAKFITTTRHQSTWDLYIDLDLAPLFYDSSKNKKDARPPEREFKHSPIPTVLTGHE